MEEEETQAGIRTTAKIMDPMLPTQDEIDEHMKVHLPYRSWCCHCVRARGKAADHRRQVQNERIIPEFHMDYMFMGSAHTKVTQDTKAATILGVKEKDKRMHMASVVPRKGGSVDFIVKRVLAFLDEMGYANSPVLFKTDQEPSIVDLVNKLKGFRAGITTFIENSPVGASASNGVMERGVQALEGMIRVLKDALETRWGVEIDSNHKIISWIAEYAAVLLNRYEVGHDGKTGYERTRGKPSKIMGIEFGEKLLFRRHPIGQRLAKMESLWVTGIFVGYRSQSGEYMIANKDGTYKTRTIKRVPFEDRWGNDHINYVLGTPWCPMGTEGPDNELMPAVQIKMKEPMVEVEKPKCREDWAIPRRMYISKKDVAEHGATAGCPGCHAVIMKKNPVGHNEECRKIIQDKISMSTQGKKRMKEADDRQKDFIAKTIENSERNLAVPVGAEKAPSSGTQKDSDQEKRRRTAIDGEVVTGPTPPSASSSRPSPMDIEVKIKRKRDEADDGDQDMQLENAQEPGSGNSEQAHLNTEVRKN